MTDYDIRKAFEKIENELIASMIRNMEKHREWETDEGFQWEQWQALQLKELAAYRKRNQKLFGGEFKKINKHLEEAIRKAREEGNMQQELELLKMVRTGRFKKPKITKGMAETNAEFFKMNDRKMDALIQATVSDMEKAETAILRMANDKYRKVIFDAQVYAASGAGTYEKAIDMATRDFLAAGLNCVEYKNGARHTLKDYADMALRTASKRAYLTGEGEKRKEWGIATVIMNKRGNPCPLCLPFVGKVMIDDVWSGGSSKDGNYPLMSSAISAGLYHPRCRDSHSTYFEGISTPPDDKFTKEEIKQIEAVNKAESKKQYIKRQKDRLNRLEKYSLDPVNKREYAKKIDSLNEEPFLKYGKEGNYTEEEHDRMVTVVTTGLQRFPEKIRETLREYELVTGSNVNACDVIHKKLYIGQDVDQYILDHEMGHLVEALFIDKDILRALKVDILKDVNDNDIITEIRHDSEGNIVPIIYVDVDDFYSSYQGRIYVGDEGLDGIFDDNRNIKVDNLWEIISETMPHYMDGEEPLNDTIAKIYELIDEVFNEKQG